MKINTLLNPKFMFRRSDITDRVVGALYGGFEGHPTEDGFFNSIYKIEELGDKFILDSDSEATSDNELDGMYEDLKPLGVDVSNSIILTNNVKMSKYDNMITFPFILAQWIRIIQARESYPYVPYTKEYIEKLKTYKKPYKFMCLNGEVREQRLYLVQELHRKGYDKKGLVSLMDQGGYGLDTYRRNFNGRRSIPHQRSENISNDIFIEYPYEFDEEYFSKLPFLLDTIEDKESNNWKAKTKYWPDGQLEANRQIPKQFIEDCYLQFTSETTYWSSDGRYHHKMDCVSEKIYKSILFHPSLIFGSPGNLTLLKSYGFKTFSPLLDESYDEIKSDSDRFWALFKEIDRLMALSEDDLHDLFVECLPIIEYNQNQIFSMDYNSLIDKVRKEIQEKMKNN